MPRKTKISTEVAHVTRDLDTTFKVKVTGAGAYCGGLPPFICFLLLFSLVAGALAAAEPAYRIPL